jgi:hypothetical protein
MNAGHENDHRICADELGKIVSSLFRAMTFIFVVTCVAVSCARCGK